MGPILLSFYNFLLSFFNALSPSHLLASLLNQTTSSMLCTLNLALQVYCFTSSLISLISFLLSNIGLYAVSRYLQRYSLLRYVGMGMLCVLHAWDYVVEGEMRLVRLVLQGCGFYIGLAACEGVYFVYRRF